MYSFCDTMPPNHTNRMSICWYSSWKTQYLVSPFCFQYSPTKNTCSTLSNIFLSNSFSSLGCFDGFWEPKREMKELTKWFFANTFYYKMNPSVYLPVTRAIRIYLQFCTWVRVFSKYIYIMYKFIFMSLKNFCLAHYGRSSYLKVETWHIQLMRAQWFYVSHIYQALQKGSSNLVTFSIIGMYVLLKIDNSSVQQYFYGIVFAPIN